MPTPYAWLSASEQLRLQASRKMAKFTLEKGTITCVHTHYYTVYIQSLGHRMPCHSMPSCQKPHGTQ